MKSLPILVAAMSAASWSFASWSIALAGEPSTAELQEQIRLLQQKVERLESQQPQALDPRVVNETVERVLRDSEKRSQLLQTDASLTAGFQDGEFFLASTDGNWSLVPHIHFQLRNSTNFDTTGGDSIENGFEIRRMKLVADGTAVTKDLSYHFQWNASTTTGSLILEDAWARYVFDPAHGLSVRGGQYKDIWSKEWNIPDSATLAVDRSLMDALIGGQLTNRVQGVTLMQDTDRTSAQLLYHDGPNTANTNFEDNTGGLAFFGASEEDFGVAGRFDYYLSEKSKETNDFTALGNKQDLLVVGGGFDWTQGGSNDAFFHTLDIQFENTKGLALYAAAIGVSRDISRADAGGPPIGTFYDWGILAQAAYLLNDKLEVFGRYDFTKLDGDALAAGAEDNIHEITVGANYYFHKHNAKLTLDLNWLPNGSPTAVTGLDVLASDDDEFIVRAQFQLYL